MDEEDAAARSALKPHKVPTRQLTIRECCGGAKGVRYADLPAADGGDEAPQRAHGAGFGKAIRYRLPETDFAPDIGPIPHLACADIEFRARTGVAANGPHSAFPETPRRPNSPPARAIRPSPTRPYRRYPHARTHTGETVRIRTLAAAAAVACR